jgi:hypothetical protein
MTKETQVCEMCSRGRHSHCAGLRFTAKGIAFKPDPEVGCACRDCDKLKERWIYCDRCKVNIATPGYPSCGSCRGTP